MSTSILPSVAPQAREQQDAADKRLVTTALALRSFEISRTAWIDPGTGCIAKVGAGIADIFQDAGLKTLNSEIDFALPIFASNEAYRFPAQARVEVETVRTEWPNRHPFTGCEKFSVSTEEKVRQK